MLMKFGDDWNHYPRKEATATNGRHTKSKFDLTRLIRRLNFFDRFAVASVHQFGQSLEIDVLRHKLD